MRGAQESPEIPAFAGMTVWGEVEGLPASLSRLRERAKKKGERAWAYTPKQAFAAARAWRA
jgi:hypothetical protein